MEFNEKLQELRKHKGLTQEELAQKLFVSRTAISKWESGRGYPNIDSLKALAKFFSITVDELLSSDELLNIAEKESAQKEKYFRDLAFGLIDCGTIMFLFLPFFGQKTEAGISAVSMLKLTDIAPYLKVLYFVVIAAIVVTGILSIALQNCEQRFWVKYKNRMSLLLNAVGVLLFIVSMQPYAAAMLFVFLVIKALMLIKWH